jgi:hypothetical protein
VIIAFDDEEQGLNGSRYFVDHPLWPLANAVAAVIFDTMGRTFMDLRSWTFFVLGSEYSDELRTIVTKRNGPGMLLAGTDLVGPRSDFAPFAAKRIPYLFFTHATHPDYHGTGDTPDKLNYTRLAQDADLIGGVIRDIASLKAKLTYRDMPAYPDSEVQTLVNLLKTVQAEKKDLPRAYALVFDDMQQRIKPGTSRETLRVAASALLASATPRLSPFMLDFLISPFYEAQGKPEVAAAVKEESARWNR